MAKNKNRKQERQGSSRSSRTAQTREHAEQSAMESQSPITQAQGSPADAARRQQRRFGHN